MVNSASILRGAGRIGRYGRDLYAGLKGTVRQGLHMPAAYLGDGVVLAETWRGDFIYLDGSDSGVTPHIIRSGRWESEIETEFARILRKGMRVIDVGAHCGYYTLVACRLVGAGGHVLAVDANARMCKLVWRSVLSNGHERLASIRNAAVMDRPGTLSFNVPDDGSSYGTFNPVGADRPHKTLTVDATTLDDLAGGQPVHVIKIDAEGAEPLIWDGARAVLEQNRKLAIFMEFMPDGVANIRPPGDFFDQIVAQGFRVSIIQSNGLAAVDRATVLQKPWSELLLERDA